MHVSFGMSLYSAVGLRLSITDDVDDPLDDLLNELDEERPKIAPSGKAGKQPTSSLAAQKIEDQGKNIVPQRVPVQHSSLQEPVQEPTIHRSLEGKNQG